MAIINANAKGETEMLRGYQKKVVYLKNTGSEIFKEAYFVLEEGKVGSKTTKELVDEANRIIDENFYGKRGRLFKRILPLVSFLLGIALSFASFLVYLYTNI